MRLTMSKHFSMQSSFTVTAQTLILFSQGGGDSLLVSDGEVRHFCVCKTLSTLGAQFGVLSVYLLMRKFGRLSVRLSFLLKHCRAVAEKAIKPFVFMYHEASSISLGSKNVLNLV